MLDRFLPEFLKREPRLSRDRRRAIWAITHCRTPALGGSRYACDSCSTQHFAFHSCNHKACPRCGRAATAKWVEGMLGKRVNAPYFLVTFTVPQELRSRFFGSSAKEAYDLFFAAASAALAEKLATAKGLRAQVNGFIAVLHTWGQQMQFHPHIHFLVPGAGINAKGKVVTVRKADYLVHLPLLKGAFKEHFKKRMIERGWNEDPAVWRKDWGVHIEAVGSGAEAVKYLGNYVSRSVISDSRIVNIDKENVTFRWCDRSDKKRMKTKTVSGVDFVRDYLRHVLPTGLRAIRYYGFCHPAAKKNRERIKMHTGTLIFIGPRPVAAETPPPACPRCEKPMRLVERIARCPMSRAPPGIPVLRFS